MYPSINDGDTILVKKYLRVKELVEGEIVIANLNNQLIIKRVFSVGVDTLSSEELDSIKKGHFTLFDFIYKKDELQLSSDQVFLIGDNLISSTDSRDYGSIDKNLITDIFITKLSFSPNQYLKIEDKSPKMF